jgi:hypothetical protein
MVYDRRGEVEEGSVANDGNDAMTSRKFLTIKCFHHNLIKT